MKPNHIHYLLSTFQKKVSQNNKFSQCTSVALGFWLKHLSHAINNQLICNTICRVVLVVVGSGVEPVTRHPPWSRDDTCHQLLLS